MAFVFAIIIAALAIAITATISSWEEK